MRDFDKIKIREALSGRPTQLAIAYSTACAARLVNSLGDCAGYDQAIGNGKKALHALEEFLIHEKELPANLERQILDLIPDEDDDPSFFAAALDDALAALMFAVRAVTVSAIECACDAAARAFDTAFRLSSQGLNVTLLTDTSVQLALESSNVQRELERQQRDLDDITGSSRSMKATIQLLLTRSAREALL